MKIVTAAMLKVLVLQYREMPEKTKQNKTKKKKTTPRIPKGSETLKMHIFWGGENDDTKQQPQTQLMILA